MANICEKCNHHSVCGYQDYETLACSHFQKEVVRCKDCKAFVRNSEVNTDRGDCYRYGIGCLRIKKIDDFCSYGERREGE